jgi:hypothetical protein
MERVQLLRVWVRVESISFPDSFYHKEMDVCQQWDRENNVKSKVKLSP